MGTGGWWVVLEENQGAGEREWTLSHSQAVGERESARAEALRLAREHVPAHPWFLRARQVLRISPDAYLVIATGRTSTFHFRVLVAELVE
ncbi:hypothetical protein [Saccharothrix coeruleofusca]|uniref:Uncharacterized protein n=1 Tax=Saccharothrix coeruleofusca TaxID=33919 RepID=A0A918EI07_9PSEU|nr:hypothetical protein [Saccharothrix coeruleofusca]MBP2336904.1 sarcosine oxidase gamma subunit [Saccharothrix coeruleofusca]GGP81990.1 hypothetical protein GCM10010185_65050 [Saccharothrix coeruleofusca]